MLRAPVGQECLTADTIVPTSAVVDLPEPMIPSTEMRRDRSIAPIIQLR